jgi:hypothetical protein
MSTHNQRPPLDPAIAAQIRKELAAIDWRRFNLEVFVKVRPLVEANAEARRRSMASMRGGWYLRAA